MYAWRFELSLFGLLVLSIAFTYSCLFECGVGGAICEAALNLVCLGFSAKRNGSGVSARGKINRWVGRKSQTTPSTNTLKLRVGINKKKKSKKR